MKQIKIIVTTAIILIIANQSFAQNTDKGFINISGGISMPQGPWAQTVYPEATSQAAGNSSGWAANGSLFGIQGAYFFSKCFGLGASFNYGTYKTKDLNVLSAGYHESFDVDSVNTTATGYTLWSFMPGLFFKYNIHNFYFLANASMGMVHASTPQISVFVEDGGNPDGTFTQEKSTATTVGLNGGAGIGYTLFKGISVNLTANYFYSQPVFIIDNTNRVTNAGRLINNYSQPLQAFNLVFGIGYTFGKQ